MLATVSARSPRAASFAAQIALAIGLAGLTAFAPPSAASDDDDSLSEHATKRHVPVAVAIIMADHNTRAAVNNMNSVATEALVRSVRSDGDKGIILEFDGALPSSAHLTKADFNTTDGYYRKTLADGTVVLAWPEEFPQLREGDPAQGLQHYRYVNVLGGYVGVLRQPGHRFRLVYGRKTPRGGQLACSGAEACTARYHGVLDGELRPAAERTDRTTQIRGDLEITANFEAASLQGETTNITATEPGEYWPYSPWPTSRIDILDGRIVDERFTATLVGVDDDATVNLSRSVAGFGGNVTGEFYGPAGEELGGVFTATRYLDGTANDRILEGHILGKKTGGAHSLAPEDTPVSVAVRMAEGSATAAPESWITSVRSDGDRGVILDIGGPNPKTIHLTKTDLKYEETYSYYEKTAEDGTYSSLWAYENPLSADDLLEGQQYYRHLNVLGASLWIPGQAGERARLVLGRKTPSDHLPACNGASDCEAHYTGTFYGRSFLAADDSSEHRQRIRGDRFELTANFARASLHGVIERIRGQAPGASGSDPYASWPTSQLLVSDATIADGGFTAAVTGSDSARSPNLEASLSGYSGTLKGGFYGPTGEEVGGVISATRDAAGTANDRVIEGHVVGKRSSLSYAKYDPSPISDGVNRYDYSTSPRIELYGADDNVNAVFTDGRGTHIVRYTIDGVSRPALIVPEDLGRNSAYPNVYTTRTGDRQTWLSKPYSGSHMDIAGFHLTDYASETSDTVTRATFGYVAFGNRTDAEEMPGGTANYSGKMEAVEWQARPESASAADASWLRGALALTANFDRGRINGRMQSLQRWTPGSSDYAPVSGQLTFSSGRVAGNELTANLRGLGYTGSMKGAFYGPEALEVGGTLRGTKSGGGMLQGWFAGGKN